MTDLDDATVYQRLDPQGMLGWLRDLPQQCRDAWRLGLTFSLPPDYEDIDKVVVLGMGGSAIGGDIVQAVAALESPVPVFVQRGYHLPPFVDDYTLVVASSYSGETEETLSAFSEALALGVKKLAITTGGRLLGLAQEHDIPVLGFNYRAEPRAALGYSLMLLLAVAQKVGLVSDKDQDVEEACIALEELRGRLDVRVPTAHNPAKQLAQRLCGRLPVVYGAGHLAAAARRWKTQLNENSKVWAFCEELSEANHNAIVGYALPREVAARAFVVLLRSDALHPRLLLRYRATQEALVAAGVECEMVQVAQGSPLAQILTGILYGDYVSYYLALLNGVEPAPTPPIQALKERLAQSP